MWWVDVPPPVPLKVCTCRHSNGYCFSRSAGRTSCLRDGIRNQIVRDDRTNAKARRRWNWREDSQPSLMFEARMTTRKMNVLGSVELIKSRQRREEMEISVRGKRVESCHLQAPTIGEERKSRAGLPIPCLAQTSSTKKELLETRKRGVTEYGNRVRRRRDGLRWPWREPRLPLQTLLRKEKTPVISPTWYTSIDVIGAPQGGAVSFGYVDPLLIVSKTRRRKKRPNMQAMPDGGADQERICPCSANRGILISALFYPGRWVRLLCGSNHVGLGRVHEPL